MQKNHVIIVLLLLFYRSSCEAQNHSLQVKVKTGAEVLIEKHLSKLGGRSVGLVANPTARINNTHVLDTLLSLGVDVKALFAPEHGFRGNMGAGELIEDGVDTATGLPVYSLYGKNKKPTKEMLSGIDLLIFDMQDVGARFYTYNTTMKYTIEASSELGKEVWILDRPNPAGGEYVSGWILESEFESFVGAYPIPIAHGLTLGELAFMAVGEGWLEIDDEPNIKVIEMEKWKRNMKWPETGLAWIPPSPNLPTFEHAFTYLGTCFFEGTTLSEGRGTDDPFLMIGSPKTQIAVQKISELATKYKVQIDTISFIPRTIPGKAIFPKFENEVNKGIKIKPSKEFDDPVLLGYELIHLVMKNTPSAAFKDYLFLLSGTKRILENQENVEWGDDFDQYIELRKKYFLYD